MPLWIIANTLMNILVNNCNEILFVKFFSREVFQFQPYGRLDYLL